MVPAHVRNGAINWSDALQAKQTTGSYLHLYVRTLVLISAVSVLIFGAPGRMQHAAGPCVDVLLLRCKDVPQLLWVNALGHINVSGWADCESTDAFAPFFKLAVNNACLAKKPTDAFVARLQHTRAVNAGFLEKQASYPEFETASAKWHEVCRTTASCHPGVHSRCPEVQKLTLVLWRSRKRRHTLHAEVR